MKKFVIKKKDGSSAIGYVFMFMTVMILVILTLYLGSVAKLMTHQHHVDDALADSVLASLVADDVYYFETYESTGTPIIRYRDVDDSHRIFVECMNAAVTEISGFYYNFSFDTFVCYEVEEDQIRITEYTGNAGNKSISICQAGSVFAPTGERVSETSAYARVRFDIKSMIDGSFITKTRDIYCTLEINE